MPPGVFEAADLLQCSQDQLWDAVEAFVDHLVPFFDDMEIAERKIAASPNGSRDRQSGLSRYASASSEIGSDDSISFRRMALGPSGASFLRNRFERGQIVQVECKSEPTNNSAVGIPDRPPMQAYFEATMRKIMDERAEKDRRKASRHPTATSEVESPDMPDIEMESVGSRHSRLGKYDPDDLTAEIRRPQVATAELGGNGGNTIQIMRVSAISDLKEFSGMDKDEDRARSWIGKVKSAFLRYQAPDDEKCLVFGDLLAGPARYWYRQLARSTRNKWKPLLESFLIEFGGYGVSTGRQYYHARKRPDETPLDYLYRLKVMGMQAKIQVKDGSAAVRKEHVDHFIDTLDNRDLADQLLLLRLGDAMEMEKTLREY